jgi:putative glutamine amidotransferase
MARGPRDPQASRTISRSRPHMVPGTRPLVGVVTHELRAEPQPAWAPAPGRRERDLAPQRLSMRLTYMQAVQEAGGIAVVIPAHGFADDAAALLDRLDGLVFSGGPDIDPSVYGADPHPLLGPDVDRAGDEYELALLAGAVERDLPVLGICRGMQALNVARGGTLHQHLPDRTDVEHRQGEAPFEPVHRVSLAARSLLYRLAGSAWLAVNSFHHQAADRIGEGLRVCATAPDGTVEGLWDPGARFCVGVQWHPEVLTHRSEHAALFHGLVAAAAASAAPSLALVA